MGNNKQESQWFQRYVDLTLEKPWRVIVISVLIVLGFAAGMPGLGFDNNYSAFFSDKNPQLQAFEKQQQIYTKNDNILFAIIPDDGEVFAPEVLAAIEDLSGQAWTIPYALRVDSVTNFQHTTATEDELVVADLVENARQKSTREIARLKQIALNEPVLRGQLINHDASAAGVNVTLQLPQESELEVPEAMAKVREIADYLEANYPVTVKLTGIVGLSNAFFEASMQDMATLVPAMFLIIVIVIFGLLRSTTATIATIVVIFLAIFVAMGAAGWYGLKLTPVSTAAPIIIMTLAVADSIHILTTVFAGLRRGVERKQAIRDSLRVNLAPVALTSITTAVGFITLNFSDAPPFWHLGNITAIGVMAAFLLSIFVLPAVVVLLPLKTHGVEGALSQSMERLGNWVVKNNGKLIIVCSLVSVVLCSLISRNELNDNFVGYFDESIQFREDTDYINEHLTGVYQILYSLDSGEDYGVATPEFLQHVEAFTAWLRAQPEVLNVNAISDTFKRINKNMNGDDEAFYKLPNDGELAAQYLLLYELSLPLGMDLNNQLTIDKSATQVVATIEDTTSNQLREIASRGENWWRERTGGETVGVGPAIMFAHISDRNINNMIVGTSVAIVVISLMILIALKNIRLGLLSFVPNLLPIAIAFGLWGVFVGEVNVAVATVASIVLGIVVDDTVHFLSKYLRARREEGMDRAEAIRYSFSSVGVAILVTSTVLVAGFVVLAQSNFGLNAKMASLTAIAIVVALVADFLLLPTLLLRFDRAHYKEFDTNQTSLVNP